MKILYDDIVEKRLHIMGLSQEEFDTIKLALARMYSSTDRTAHMADLSEAECRKAINMWSDFSQSEISAVSLSTVRMMNTEEIPSGIVAVDLGLPSGTKWADCNLGAESPEQYGDYFRFGETTALTKDAEGYKIMNLGNDIAGTEYDAATAIMGENWRIPTFKQVNELLNNCSAQWQTREGINGMCLTGKNGKSIFIPSAGRLKKTINGLFNNEKDKGFCWISSPCGNDAAFILSIGQEKAEWTNSPRADGLSIRPVLKRHLTVV